MDKSFYELDDSSGIIILFWIIAIFLSFLLIFYLFRCTYKHKNKLIFITVLLIFTTITQVLNIWILSDIAVVNYRTDALIIWINTHDWVPIIFTIGCVGAAIQISITLYLLINYKFKKKDLSDFDLQLERKQIVLFSGIAVSCIVICVALSIGKDKLFQQEIILDYKDDEMFIPHVEGYNGQGYFDANESDYPNSPKREEVLSGDRYAFIEDRQLYYLKYLFLFEDIEYIVTDGENGSYQNGDVAKLQMKLKESESSYNIKITGVTSYETVIEGLIDYQYKSYTDINTEDLETINESLNAFIDKQYKEEKTFGYGASADTITLIKKGFYNNYTSIESKDESDEFDPQCFTATELINYDSAYSLFHKENKMVYLYEVKPTSGNIFYATVTLTLNENNLNDLKEGKLSFNSYRDHDVLSESSFLNSINETYNNSIQWIEE